MPSIEEVRQKVTGTDPIDTFARQYGAFRQLAGIVQDLCAGSEFHHQCTAEEISVARQYGLAATKADRDGAQQIVELRPGSGSNAPAPNWFLAKSNYDNDRFRQQLLDMFSPRIRGLYRSRYKSDDDKIAEQRAKWPPGRAYPSVVEVIAADRMPSLSLDLKTIAHRAARLGHLVQIVRTRWGTEAPGQSMKPTKQILIDAYSHAAIECDRTGESILAHNGASLSGTDSYVAQWFRIRKEFDGDARTVNELLEFGGVKDDLGAVQSARQGANHVAAIVRLALADAKASASGPAAWTPSPPDPSVAVARAKHVNTIVFGIPVGEPLLAPECATSDATGMIRSLGVSTPVNRMCWLPPNAMPLTMTTRQISIHLPRDKRPSWVHSITAVVENEVVRQVFIATVQADIEAELTKLQAELHVKGNRTKIDNDARSVEWSLPGLHVVYERRMPSPQPGSVVMSPDFIGAVQGVGQVAAYASMPNLLIETESYRAQTSSH